MQLNEALDVFRGRKQAPESSGGRKQRRDNVDRDGDSVMVSATQEGYASETHAPTTATNYVNGSGAAPIVNGLHGRGIPEAALLKMLHSGQVQLIEMLMSLSPDEDATASAACKQLCQIIAEARKHARRRLRQMDTQLEQRQRAAASSGGGKTQGGGTFWNPGGSGGGQSPHHNGASGSGGDTTHPFGSLGLELLGQGVHLYLEELEGVLNKWAENLGIETKSGGACSKKPRRD